MGVKGQSQVIWGHKVYISIFTKNALSLLCNKCTHVIHTLASHLVINRQTGVSLESMSYVSKPAATPSVTATCLVTLLLCT